MNTYRFETVATMKPYNLKKYWIDSEIVRPIIVQTDSFKDALKLYQKNVMDRHYIEISDNAIKNASPMFVDLKNGDTKQTGLVITASTDFSNKKQYIDLWVEVFQIIPVNFEEVYV